MAEEKQQARAVRCMVAPLEGSQIVVPNSVIIQIVSYSKPEPIKDGPPWLIGKVNWQKRHIPVMSFELATGKAFNPENSASSRYVIFKSLNHRDTMPFYALVISGIPHPERIEQDNISVNPTETPSSPLILNEVTINDETACIPNLDALEEMLIQQQELLLLHEG
jgi:chemosensory pili system protein ChpC